MNINTVLLIILILVIVFPKLRRNLNKMITPLSLYMLKFLMWLGYFLVGAGILYLIYIIGRLAFSFLKKIYLKDPMIFVAYAVISVIVIIFYIADKKYPKLKLREQWNNLSRPVVRPKFWLWFVIIISIAMGILALFAYFFVKQ